MIESKHTIDKRDVECKIAVPKEEVPTPAAGADASTKTRKIFVGGLAPTVDDQVCPSLVPPVLEPASLCAQTRHCKLTMSGVCPVQPAVCPLPCCARAASLLLPDRGVAACVSLPAAAGLLLRCAGAAAVL